MYIQCLNGFTEKIPTVQREFRITNFLLVNQACILCIEICVKIRLQKISDQRGHPYLFLIWYVKGSLNLFRLYCAKDVASDCVVAWSPKRTSPHPYILPRNFIRRLQHYLKDSCSSSSRWVFDTQIQYCLPKTITIPFCDAVKHKFSISLYMKSKCPKSKRYQFPVTNSHAKLLIINCTYFVNFIHTSPTYNTLQAPSQPTDTYQLPLPLHPSLSISTISDVIHLFRAPPVPWRYFCLIPRDNWLTHSL